MMNVDLPGVSPLMGGILSQDMIKTMAGKGEPICNVFVHDGITHIGKVLSAIPKSDTGKDHGASSSKATTELVLLDD